jgi:hypothetical protein
MITPLNLPQAPLDLLRRNGEIYVKCVLRKKYLLLTPEEWVRQHIIYTLITDYKVSTALVAAEVGLKYNGRKKRADVIVYSQSGAVDLLIECKAPDVRLDKETLFQIAQYNAQFNAPKLLISNGIEHFSIVPENGIEILPGFMNFDQ